MNSTNFSSSLLGHTLVLGMLCLPLACSDDGNAEGTTDNPETTGSSQSGDGDGDDSATTDPATDTATGDGDGDGPPCDPGTFGCPCNGGLCDAGLMCVDGICEIGGEPCDPGTEDCECDNGMCNAGLECVEDNCEPVPLPEGPYDNCGWDGGNEWYACGFSLDNPQVPIDCTMTYILGEPCGELSGIGCCEPVTGNNYYCATGGVIGGEACGDDPLNMGGGDGDGDGDGGDGDGDGGDGDGDGGDGDGDAMPLTFAADVYPIIEASCSCHVNGNSGGLSMSDADTAYMNLFEIAANAGMNNVRVVPNDSANSMIYKKVSGDLMGNEGSQMPLNGMPLMDADQQTIADWIDAGANP